MSPENHLYLRKLDWRAPLSAMARAAFIALPTREREYGTYRDIVREGERATHSCYI